MPATVAFFRELGVELKCEPTGKLFPKTDRARTVLDALLAAARDAGVELRHPAKVEHVSRTGEGFRLATADAPFDARAIILAAGGKALPKSGSDGGGHQLARSLGHSTTPHIFPALVPLVLSPDCFIPSLSGLTLPARLELRSGTGRRLRSFTDSTLCTHFALSGPAVMDISRYYIGARHDDVGARLLISWLPDLDRDAVDAELRLLGRQTIRRWLRGKLPERLADAVCLDARLDPDAAGAHLSRDARHRLLNVLLEMPLPVIGDRGFTHAEATAGGIPLGEIRMTDMSSKCCPGLFLCGEICDVDGRIGGFNFQWAWASGHIAGRSAVAALLESEPDVAEQRTNE